jgi:hypothetical protein
VDPVPDPLLLRKSGSAGNRPRDICSQKLWPLDHRGGIYKLICQKCNLNCLAKSGSKLKEHFKGSIWGVAKKKSPTIKVFSTHLNTTHNQGNMESTLELISYATEKKIIKPWKTYFLAQKNSKYREQTSGEFNVWRQATLCKLLTNAHKPYQTYALRHLTFKWRWC